MKFVITHYDNNDKKVSVKNISDKDFSYKTLNIAIGSGKSQDIPAHHAKIVFGDWDDDTLKEKNRQKSMNIHLFEVRHTYKSEDIKPIETVKETGEQIVRVEEFEGLKTLEELKEDKQCEGITASGERCKRKATHDGFCPLHKKG